MKPDFDTLLKNATSLADIFEIVKTAVLESDKKSRGGLMLGLADLGNHPQGWMGAFYPVGTNIIVMNKIPLQRIKETNLKLYKPYAFHVLLHEYIHSLGYLDEGLARKKVYEITKAVFGEEHLSTQLAKDTSTFFPNLVYPDVLWRPEDLHIELVEGFDYGSVNYIG
ncbi:MAG: hypothetical protein JSW00_01405 [Thermoplasmata archaeon]|nr:MAG: hypothetical protein JSW00_01405 [Thermoplasmata archaeon]